MPPKQDPDLVRLLNFEVHGWAADLPVLGQQVYRELLLLSLTRPVARPQLATREDRLEDPALRAAYALAKLEELPIPLPICEACGDPTHSWCDFCRAGALCLESDRVDFACPDCYQRLGRAEIREVARFQRAFGQRPPGI